MTEPTAPTDTDAITTSLACELGRHAACKNLVVSVLFVGPCACRCHAIASAGKAA